MARYHFVTDWTFEADIAEVADILADAPAFTRWWPSVYLTIVELEAGDERSVGARYDLYTKGWLPYTLRWQLRVTSSNRPFGFTLDASGDFVGTGVWTLRQDGPRVHVRYDWDIAATKPLLRRLSFALRPIFSANHRWAMAKGAESLRLELLRRRARTPEERAAIPPPPPATFVRSRPRPATSSRTPTR